jgi:hypothetical protein
MTTPAKTVHDHPSKLNVLIGDKLEVATGERHEIVNVNRSRLLVRDSVGLFVIGRRRVDGNTWRHVITEHRPALAPSA